MSNFWLKIKELIPEEVGENMAHIGVLILSGNVRWLISFAAVVNEKLSLNDIKTATTFAREKLAVADFLFGMKVLGGIVSNETLFTLASDCVLAGNLLGLKQLEQSGFVVGEAQKHTAINCKLYTTSRPNLLEQRYPGYLAEWIEILTRRGVWRNEEEREYAYSILREAKQKRNKSAE